MKLIIQVILERELAKLNALSASSPEPLQAREIKSLDTVIRAYRAFVEPTSTQSDSAHPAESDPASQSTDDLLKNVLTGQ